MRKHIEYRISVRGEIPADLGERISAMHARAIIGQVETKTPSGGQPDPAASGRVNLSEQLSG